MGLLFYPRGGSARGARYLSRALAEAGWEVTLASGSLGSPGEASHAATFYAGLRVTAADFTPAPGAFVRGDDPMAASMPFHPSYTFLAELDGCAAQQLSLEAAEPDLDPAVLEQVPKKTVILGVLNLDTTEIEEPALVAEQIRKALRHVPVERSARRR